MRDRSLLVATVGFVGVVLLLSLLRRERSPEPPPAQEEIPEEDIREPQQPKAIDIVIESVTFR